MHNSFITFAGINMNVYIEVGTKICAYADDIAIITRTDTELKEKNTHS